MKLEIVVAADEAELLFRAIEQARQQLTPPLVSAGEPVASAAAGAPAPVAPRPSAADALMHVAALHLAGSDRADAMPRADVTAGHHAEVVIHLAQDPGAPDRALAATLEDGTRVSAEAFRRIACDGGLVAAVVAIRARSWTWGAARAQFPRFAAPSRFATAGAGRARPGSRLNEPGAEVFKAQFRGRPGTRACRTSSRELTPPSKSEALVK